MHAVYHMERTSSGGGLLTSEFKFPFKASCLKHSAKFIKGACKTNGHDHLQTCVRGRTEIKILTYQNGQGRIVFLESDVVIFYKVSEPLAGG